MATLEEVETFLRDAKVKLGIFPFVTRDRSKNLKSLIELDIRPIDQLSYLMGLTAENYMSGPNKDKELPGQPDFYEFGINIRGVDVYVKFNLGRQNKPIDVISFHKSEKANIYPLKKE